MLVLLMELKSTKCSRLYDVMFKPSFMKTREVAQNIFGKSHGHVGNRA